MVEGAGCRLPFSRGISTQGASLLFCPSRIGRLLSREAGCLLSINAEQPYTCKAVEGSNEMSFRVGGL